MNNYWDIQTLKDDATISSRRQICDWMLNVYCRKSLTILLRAVALGKIVEGYPGQLVGAPGDGEVKESSQVWHSMKVGAQKPLVDRSTRSLYHVNIMPVLCQEESRKWVLSLFSVVCSWFTLSKYCSNRASCQICICWTDTKHWSQWEAGTYSA